MILEWLYTRMKDFYWSKSLDGSIVVGGYLNGNFYGEINFNLSDEKVIVKGNWPPEFEINFNTNYRFDLNKLLFTKIERYLLSPETKMYQESNREKLMQNFLDYLTKSNHPNLKRNKI